MFASSHTLNREKDCYATRSINEKWKEVKFGEFCAKCYTSHIMANAATTRPLSSIKYFTVHHAGAGLPPAKDLATLKKRADSYDRHHAPKSWATYTQGELGYTWIAYHYMIAADGAVLQVQDTKYMRHHAGDNPRGSESHNRWGIAIVVDGDFNLFEPTDAQLQAAADIIYRWEKEHKINTTVRGHKETSLGGTSCPGINMGTSTEAGSNLRKIINLVNEKHGGTLPDEDTMRINELRKVRAWLRVRRSKKTNPIKKNELTLLINHISARIVELEA